MSQSLNRIPCTIVTGFLGSGKTTLLRHLLTHHGNRKIGVIVNEFGDIGIDGDLLKNCGSPNCSEDSIVELANGCICCTVADDFVPALQKLLSQPEKIDHILIETSGLALPKPLVQAFQWPEIRSKVTVDSVITVADVAALADGRVAHDLEELNRQRQEDETLDHDDPIEEVFEDQLACADLILLSKSDLVNKRQLEKIKEDIRCHMDRLVKILPVHNGEINPDLILGLNLSVEDDIDNRHSHHDHEEEHDHDDFETFYVDLPVFDNPQTILKKIDRLIQDHHILRIKGFVDIQEKPMRLLIQAVGKRIDHHYDRAWEEVAQGNIQRRGRLVIIGEHGLNQKKIQEVLVG